MTDPQIDICEDYLTIYDKKGNYDLYHDKGGNLRRNRNDNADPAGACGIAGNGGGSDEKKDASGYLAMYDKTGAKLTEGEIHGAKKGIRSRLHCHRMP